MKRVKGFTKRYNVSLLVWYELYHDINEAIAREKNLKTWQRAWKLRIIEDMNPDWRDLYEELNH
jgi:putative endonuclease